MKTAKVIVLRYFIWVWILTSCYFDILFALFLAFLNFKSSLWSHIFFSFDSHQLYHSVTYLDLVWWVFFTHGGYTTIEFWKKYFHEVPCRCSHGLLAYRNEYPLNNIERTVDSRLALMKSIKYIDIICKSKTTRDILNTYILIICWN